MDENKKLHFELSFWDAKLLLEDLGELMHIINRDNEHTYQIFEIIASQLNDKPVIVQRPQKKELPKEEEKPEDNKKWFEFWK